MRTTSGNVIFPPVRQRYRPTCVISWSRQGYENASYCISQTGRQPAMQRPTAVPRIPASASGVSTQRFSPNRSRSPAVARKTPPARPTSSPITRTESSRSSSTWNASLIASTISRSAKPALPEVRRRVDVRVLEHQLDVGLRLRLGGVDARAHDLGSAVLDLRLEVVAEHAEPAQVPLVAAEAFVRPFLLDSLEVDVRPGIVRRRMRRGPVRERLDERRAAARARAHDRFARRL